MIITTKPYTITFEQVDQDLIAWAEARLSPTYFTDYMNSFVEHLKLKQLAFRKDIVFNNINPIEKATIIASQDAIPNGK